jgi:hypothetical protein
MKYHSVVFAALLFIVAHWPALAEVSSREAAVRTAVASFGSAFVEADVPTLEALLTDTYVHVNGSSGNILNRNEWLTWVKTRQAELEAGTLVVSDYRIEDLEVELFGEAAVVTGVAISSGIRNGDSFDTRLRFSNVWIFGGGGWRRAAFHDSPILKQPN